MGEVRKVLKASMLARSTPNHWLQSIVKERLTRKVFYNSYLAGLGVQAGSGSLWRNTLRCKCARVHCALLPVRVKVIRHMDGELGCGKGERCAWQKKDDDRFQCKHICRVLCRPRPVMELDPLAKPASE